MARGEPRTQLVLGTMLFNGDGIPRDFPRAYALMTRASASGLQSASQTLAQMDQYISPADREKGTALAQQYALQATPAAPSRSTVGASARVDVPASRVTETPRPARPTPGSPPVRVAAPTREPAPKQTMQKPAPVKTVAASPAPKTAQKTAQKPAPKSTPVRATGNWRVQLGAFRDQGNAETQWNKVRGKLRGAQPFYAKAGSVTRLQAGGFASKADATRACSAAGVPCVVVAP